MRDAAHELLELLHVGGIVPRLDVQDDLGHVDHHLELARGDFLLPVRLGDGRQALLVLLIGLRIIIVVAPEVAPIVLLATGRRRRRSRRRSRRRAELRRVRARQLRLGRRRVGVD